MHNELLSKLLEKIEKVNKKVNAPFVTRAFNFAREAHEGQFRMSGEPYYIHPYEVAMILADLGMDDVTISSALLHDVLEDTEVTHEEMEKEFGKEVVDLVEGVTKLGKIPYSSKEEQQIENLRKMFLAMANDIRVILIKLADRLHNMRTMKSLPEEKRLLKALETMEIYAPLAHRLGIYNIKWELEDISLMYLDPIGYKEISTQIAEKREERLDALEAIKTNIMEKINEAGIKASIDGRVKHFYSIYRKMYTKNKTIDSIYDLFAVRVIVDSIKDCYSVLGIAHELYSPMPGRFKDYISMPKKNMYQSLHSTLLSNRGIPFEIQIRTREMHRAAEYGFAAHWKYKEGKESSNKLDEKLTWVRQLLELEKDNDNPKEFISNLKIDLFADEVFVFTPKGDVMSLPLGSTPIDFAFAIHSQIGWKMVGAKVNGKIIPLETTLKNGDIVDIITSNNTSGPSNDWLKIAKTSQARNKINAWFKKENREGNIEKGKEMLEKEFKKLGVSFLEFLGEELNSYVLKKFSFNHIDDFYATLGFGRISLEKVMNRVKDFYSKKDIHLDITEMIAKQPQKSTGKPSSGVIVKGIDNCLVKFAKCCNPVPGDDIIGYITRGRGVSVHRADCVSVFNIEKTDSARLIDVSWAESAKTGGAYSTELLVTANDREGLLMDITLILNELKIPLRGLNAKVSKDMLCFITLTIEIDGAEKLSSAINKIKSVKDIISVTRTNK